MSTFDKNAAVNVLTDIYAGRIPMDIHVLVKLAQQAGAVIPTVPSGGSAGAAAGAAPATGAVTPAPAPKLVDPGQAADPTVQAARDKALAVQNQATARWGRAKDWYNQTSAQHPWFDWGAKGALGGGVLLALLALLSKRNPMSYGLLGTILGAIGAGGGKRLFDFVQSGEATRSSPKQIAKEKLVGQLGAGLSEVNEGPASQVAEHAYRSFEPSASGAGLTAGSIAGGGLGMGLTGAAISDKLERGYGRRAGADYTSELRAGLDPKSERIIDGKSVNMSQAEYDHAMKTQKLRTGAQQRLDAFRAAGTLPTAAAHQAAITRYDQIYNESITRGIAADKAHALAQQAHDAFVESKMPALKTPAAGTADELATLLRASGGSKAVREAQRRAAGVARGRAGATPWRLGKGLGITGMIAAPLAAQIFFGGPGRERDDQQRAKQSISNAMAEINRLNPVKPGEVPTADRWLAESYKRIGRPMPSQPLDLPAPSNP